MDFCFTVYSFYESVKSSIVNVYTAATCGSRSKRSSPVNPWIFPGLMRNWREKLAFGNFTSQQTHRQVTCCSPSMFQKLQITFTIYLFGILNSFIIFRNFQIAENVFWKVLQVINFDLHPLPPPFSFSPKFYD